MAHIYCFTQRNDCTDFQKYTAFQKITAVMRLLAYGVASDSMYEKLVMVESTVHKSMLRFCDAVNFCIGHDYLRPPTDTDMTRIFRKPGAHGFPSILGSIDCSK